MSIRERFPGKVMAPVEDGNIITANNPGPSTVSGGLEQIIKDMAAQGTGGENVSHAIPNPLANITSFVKLVNEVNVKITEGSNKGITREQVIMSLEKTEKSRYLEWLGLSAVVALRGVYSMSGLEVRMEKVPLNQDSLFDCALMFAMDNMNDSYRFMIDAYDGGGVPQEGGLYYLKQGDEYFAIYNHEIGICPMQHYNAELFKDRIPWYHWSEGESEHDSWEDPLDVLQENDYAVERFKAWMINTGNGQCVGAAGVSGNLVNSFTSADWANEETLLNQAYQQYRKNNANNPHADFSILNGMADRAKSFCQVCCAYTDAAGDKHIFPRLLNRRLVLAQRSKEEPCGMGYNDDNGAWRPLILQYADDGAQSNLKNLHQFVPIIPFTGKAAELCGNAFEIREISFLASSTKAEKLDSVEVCMTLYMTGMNETFSFTHTYDLDDIRGGVLPYLMVWPWVELPRNSWNTFFATQKNSPVNFEGHYGIRLGGDLRLELKEGEKKKVQECGGGGESWEICRSNERFKYAIVNRVAGEKTFPGGVIMIPRMGEITPGAVNYNLGIDFGTTSTVCAIQEQGRQTQFLPYKDFSRNVTIGDMKTDIDEVARQRWIGRSSTETGSVLAERKILTVAQLFARDENLGTLNVGQDEPFMTGRFFLASSSMLCQYAAGGNFAARGIYNDLKLSTGTELEEQRASVLFLAGIYTQALLYVLSQPSAHNGKINQIRVSYPGGLTRDNLRALWMGATQVVNACLTSDSAYALDANRISYCTEAEAAQAFNMAIHGNMASYINIDIGGGTTDVSITDSVERKNRTLSFKYAGRELIIDSFIEIYRHWKEERAVDRSQHLEGIWGKAVEKLPPETKEQLLFNFFERCDDRDITQASLEKAITDESLRMFVEILLNDFEMLLPNTYNYNILRSTITAKFFLLMRMVGEFIRENKEMLLAGCAEEYDAQGMARKVIPMVFSGTAAETLHHVFNRPLGQLNGLQNTVLGGAGGKTESRMLNRMAEMIAQIAQIEGDIIIRLQVSPEVREKKEVAFGLLDGNVSMVSENGNKLWTLTEIADLAKQLEDAEIRSWFFNIFKKGLPAEGMREAFLEHFKNTVPEARYGDYAAMLEEKINDKKVSNLIAESRSRIESIQGQIEQMRRYWEGITEAAGSSNTTWPANAAAGADLGFGPGICKLSDILPIGNDLQTMISQCILDISMDKKKRRYLVSLENDAQRENMFVVYIVETLINKAMSAKQI